MRAAHDAVLVGGGTARADDPSLTVRGLGLSHQPVRLVAARRLDLPVAGTLGRTAREVPIWLLHGPSAPAGARAKWAETGARLIEVVETEGGLDPAAMLTALGEAGLTRVFCEGGGQLAASLLRAGLVDEIASSARGSHSAQTVAPRLGPLGLDALAAAPRFRLTERRPIGPDTLSLWSRD